MLTDFYDIVRLKALQALYVRTDKERRYAGMNARNTTKDGYGRMLGIEELQQYTGLGRSKAAAVARDIGARVKIGARTLYDKEIIDSYLTRMREEQNA